MLFLRAESQYRLRCYCTKRRSASKGARMGFTPSHTSSLCSSNARTWCCLQRRSTSIAFRPTSQKCAKILRVLLRFCGLAVRNAKTQAFSYSAGKCLVCAREQLHLAYLEFPVCRHYWYRARCCASNSYAPFLALRKMFHPTRQAKEAASKQ